MSYIPDYRKETDKLNAEDRAFIDGYRAAMEDAKCFFYNSDIYDATEDEARFLQDEALPCFEDYMEMNETECVCSLFDNADYLPNDIILIDANKEK